MYGKRLLLLTVAILAGSAFLPSPFDVLRYGSAQSSNKRGTPVAERQFETQTGIPFRALRWNTVANNSFYIPKTKKLFNSYNQPSVNRRGTVVFRARGKGHPRATGIFRSDMSGGPIWGALDLFTEIPYPNNLGTTFNEFPSVPRISPEEDYAATRGNHQPAYAFNLPDGSETRAGTTGVYAVMGWAAPITGAAKLGHVPGFEFFAVPGTDPPVPFDVFPGAPSITDDGTIVFKGNYTIDGIPKTGAFFRRLFNTPGGGTHPAEVLATSDTEIPSTPASAKLKAVKFGSVAPPTAHGDLAVFVALDNEEKPRVGGIYAAALEAYPDLVPLVEIGQWVPGPDVRFTAVGEALSFDGRFVAFWAAIGRRTKTVRLYCPEEGNQDRRNYCNGIDPHSRMDGETGRWYQEKKVPVHQGIFVYDLYSGAVVPVADTEDFDDFLFWGYTGMVPGTGHPGGESDGEEPKWRSSAYVTVSDGKVAFKARTGTIGKRNVYYKPIDGIYLAAPFEGPEISALIETGMDGRILDPAIPGEGDLVIPITGVGIEREGLRGAFLVINAKMGTEEDGWGGIYLANLR